MMLSCSRAYNYVYYIGGVLMFYSKRIIVAHFEFYNFTVDWFFFLQKTDTFTELYKQVYNF